VTRLGEFSPNGRLFTLDSFFAERSLNKECIRQPPPPIRKTNAKKIMKACMRHKCDVTFFTILDTLLQCVHACTIWHSWHFNFFRFLTLSHFYYFITFKLRSTTEQMPALVWLQKWPTFLSHFHLVYLVLIMYVLILTKMVGLHFGWFSQTHPVTLDVVNKWCVASVYLPCLHKYSKQLFGTAFAADGAECFAWITMDPELPDFSWCSIPKPEKLYQMTKNYMYTNWP
jgi:hypothetical protein